MSDQRTRQPRATRRTVLGGAAGAIGAALALRAGGAPAAGTVAGLGPIVPAPTLLGAAAALPPIGEGESDEQPDHRPDPAIYTAYFDTIVQAGLRAAVERALRIEATGYSGVLRALADRDPHVFDLRDRWVAGDCATDDAMVLLRGLSLAVERRSAAPLVASFETVLENLEAYTAPDEEAGE